MWGGYYFMTYDTAQKLKREGRIIKAFVGDFISRKHSNHPLCNLGLAFEVVFSNTSGSFIKMVEDGDSYKEVLESTIGEEVKKAFIPQLQSGVLSFTKELTTKFSKQLTNIHFDNTSCLSVWTHTLTKPAGRDAELFEGVTFDDKFSGVDWRYMVPPRRLGPMSSDLLKLSVWTKGTETFYRIPYVRDHTKKMKIKTNNSSKQIINESSLKNNIIKPNKVVHVFVKLLTLKQPKKYLKFKSDPYSFFSDSKSFLAKKIAKQYLK
jgi:hypothetical protein